MINKTLSADAIKKMSYIDFMANLRETNRPPGGKKSVAQVAKSCFITKDSIVLDAGCNTGFCTLELTHLTNCKIVGLDISKTMIAQAENFRKKDTHKSRIIFKVADAMQMPFENNHFDIVFSGGSTAFIKDKQKALSEYTRVTKPWGFIADINFYYPNNPPTKIIDELNHILGIKIHKWNKQYWLDIYKSAGLEIFEVIDGIPRQTTQTEIINYVNAQIAPLNLSKDARSAVIKKLVPIFSLFNENIKHLAYSIFILRKRGTVEEPFLFEP